ncbi:MAG TPA: hypothetical protein VHW71_10775 [Steroidobacteraceae bacterium]|nr:hypothetical protein [Steroidobacteraceae bacterium]
MLIYAIGIAGLLQDAWPAQLYRPWINLHAVFGISLCLMVLAQYRRATRHADDDDIAIRCRQLSRAVYLMLYVLFGVDLLTRAVLLRIGAAPRPGAALLPPPENLRDYLAYGLAAVLGTRLLAAWRRGGSALADHQDHE